MEDLAPALTQRERLFIGGEWVSPEIPGELLIENPATEEVLGQVPEAGPGDVDRAVAAAHRAGPGWARTDPGERSQVLGRLGGLLGAQAVTIGGLIAREVGMPVATASVIQAGLPALVLGAYESLAQRLESEERVGSSLVVRRPVGVVAAICPWNYPLHQAVAKVAPALAAGCPVVLKPSDLAPLTAFLLADLAVEAGVPPGVLNVVSGGGRVGEALVAHPGVDMISFTGSVSAGRRVAAAAGGRLRPVTLELGGKSAAIILDDADLAEAVPAAVRQSFLNSGQTCIAWSRVLVPRHLLAQAEDLAIEAARGFVLGDPLDWSTTMGPLISEPQHRRALALAKAAADEGATVLCGARRPPRMDRGHWFEPTIVTGVDNHSVLACTEVFGPVTSLISYDDDEQALALANDSPYGLHGAVFSADRDRALALARRMQTGMVDVCGGGFNPLAPWGGWKDSGLGRELGRWGLEEFLQTTSLQLP
ncbi:MAG: aldehyde dehydrogenase family protein [Acidimicrobiales bacterium]